MSEQYPYPNEETKKRSLNPLRQRFFVSSLG